MSAAPTAVLFDLDDTLYPERVFVHGGFREVAQFLAPTVERPPEALFERLLELHRTEGRGQLFDLLLAEVGRGGDRDLALACVLVYRTYEPKLTAFPGAVDLIDSLRRVGTRTGVVSDGHAAVQRRKLAALPGISSRIDFALFTDELPPGYAKPSPVPFRVACLMLDVAPGSAVYVANDPRKDFAGARAAGLATIRCGLPPDEGRATMDRVAAVDDADQVVEGISALAPLVLAVADDAQPR